MRRSLAFFLLAVSSILAPIRTQANPAAYGAQMCTMMQSGMSQKRAWNYIIDQRTKSVLAGQRSGYSGNSYGGIAGAMGFGVGSGIAAGITAGQELRGMRDDVFAIARSICPQSFGINAPPQPITLPEGHDPCSLEPWLKKCGGYAN